MSLRQFLVDSVKNHNIPVGKGFFRTLRTFADVIVIIRKPEMDYIRFQVIFSIYRDFLSKFLTHRLVMPRCLFAGVKSANTVTSPIPLLGITSPPFPGRRKTQPRQCRNSYTVKRRARGRFPVIAPFPFSTLISPYSKNLSAEELSSGKTRNSISVFSGQIMLKYRSSSRLQNSVVVIDAKLL